MTGRAESEDGGPDGRGPDDGTPPATRPRRRSLDPLGKRSLFEAPVGAARDTLRSGRQAEGKDALYSTGPRQPGTAVVECSGCDARTRVNLTELGLRLASISVWIPGKPHGHWMRCPACGRRTWCRIGWQE